MANRRAMSPLTPFFAPIITATLADDIPLANKKDPGATITYTAIISNTGTDASNVVYTDTLDSNTTLVPGSVKTTPIAFDDAYNVIGNVRIQPNAAAGLLVNDIDPDTGNNTGLLATAQTISSTNCAACGNVIIAADGSFSYNPPVGFQGSDTFTYTVNDTTGKTGTGTVTLTVSGIVWFINNNAAACTTLTLASGCGRLTNPFSTLAAFQGFNDAGAGPPTHPKTNDNIFIFESGTNYIGPVTLLGGQKLIGQDSTATLQTLTGLTPQAYSDPFPTMNATPATATTLTSGSTTIFLNNNVTSNNLNGFTVGTSTTTGINGLNFGTLNVGSVILNTGAGQALVLNNGTVGIPANYAGFTSTTSTGGTNNVSLATIAGTVNLGTGALSGAGANGLNVTGGAANINFSGTISNSTARQVSIINKTGGTVALSGAVSGTGTGIFLSANTGATINFTGGVVLSTGASDAFTATGGGTVSVTGAANTLTSTTGIALNVANTTIGASGLTFLSISSNGSVNGIVLNNTGASGGLTVTGNSAGNCGGSITVQPLGTLSTANAPVTADCTGGTIQSTTGAGIVLTSTNNVSLTRMLIQNAANGFDEISANTINGLTIDHSDITDNAGNAGDRGIEIGDFSTGTPVNGTVTISNSTIGPTPHDNIGIGIASGTSTWSFTNDVLTGSVLDSGMNFEVRNATVTSFTMDGCVVKNQFADGMQINPASGVNATITNATIQNSSFTTNNIHLDLNHDGTSNVTYKVLNNTFISATANTINFFSSSVQAPTTGGVLNGRFVNNRIGNNAIANSGGGVGMRININGGAAARVLVDSNVIRQVKDGRGIEIISRNGTGGLDATVTNNDVSAPINTLGAFAQLAAIFLQSNCVTVCNTLRSDIRSNTVPSTPATDGEFANGMLQIVRSGASTNQLVDNAPASPDAASELASHNTGTTAVTGTVTLIAGPINTPPMAQPDDGGMAANTPPQSIGNPGNGDSFGKPQLSNTALTDGGSSPSPMMLDRLKQVLHPVAAFATKLNFLRNSEVPVTPALTSAEKSAMIAEIKGTSATQKPDDQKVTPQSGETITVNGSGGGFTLPAGKTITITYQATVNSPPFSKTVSTQGHVAYTGGPGGGVPTDDPETGAAGDATVTNINTTSTWVGTGTTPTDWNDMTNWSPNTYAPGVSNPGVNDVVIPNVGGQPNIGTTDIGILSLNISNGRTLTITSPRILTMGGASAGNLILDGIISGGEFRFGTSTHTISNAGGTGSFSSTNLAQVLSGSTVTLNNNLQMGALNLNAGGSMDITSRTLSLNGSGAALTVAGGATFTTTGSTVIFNGSGAQTLTNTTAFTNLTINNTGGSVTLGSNITVNGNLTLTSDLTTTNSFTVSQPLSSITSGGGDVVGNLTRTNGGVQFPSATNITFGNPNTLLNFTAAGTRPTSINFRLTETVPTDSATGGTNTGFPGAVKRTWLITPTGGAGFSATMQLHYLVGDLNGNVETNTGPGVTVSLRLYKYVINSPSTGWQQQDVANNFANTTIDTSSPGNHFVRLVGVTGFSPWTIGGVSPTAATSTVSGRITDDAGNPVEGAVIRLNGTQDRKTITDAFGNYSFAEVETNGFYTVTPSRVNYTFAPAIRGFSALGAHTEASFAGAANGNHLNPLDTTEYFVRQQYVDFLGREPEEKALNDWTDTINNCAGDASCDRVHVSESFFRSEEFQQRGYFVYRFYSTAFGQKPDYAAFVPDLGRVSGFLDATQLEAAKNQFASDFTSRAAFINQYGTLSNSAYVDALSQTAGVTLSNRQALVNSLEAGTLTRAQALRQIAESGEVYARYYNQAFVVMEYFGYLRRDPDALYLNWISVLDANPADSRHMVEGFVDATEYRNRFKQ